EHAAPGRVGEPHQGAVDGRDHVRGNDRDGARILVLQHRRRAAASTLHHARARARRRADGELQGRNRMSWGSMDNFLKMGGYGLYVWGSYAVTLVLMVAEVVLLARRRRALRRRPDEA